MRPVAVTAVLLLVVLMSMMASAWTPEEMCRTNYPATPCPRHGNGWYQIDKNSASGIICVKAFHDNQLRYLDAEMACRKFDNGHLVSITSLVELCKVECAMYRATTEKLHYWIGLFRDGHRFIWTDGSGDSRYGNWAGGQPDNSWGREYCIEMNYWGWGLWNDAECGLERPYVCKVHFW